MNRVTIRLTSDPPGADVYRMPQGARIGSTPLTYAMEATTGKVSLTLKRLGYEDTTITVPGDRNHNEMVALGKVVEKSLPQGTGSANELKAIRPSLDPFDKLDGRKTGR
jgi:hypothetical protein